MYTKPKDIHLEITRRCPLACPKCPRTIEKGSYKANTDLSLELIQKIIKQEWHTIRLSGNLGDPIYHARALDVFRLVSKNSIHMHLHTNGTGKKNSFWEEYYSFIKPELDVTIFGIDGLQDTSKIYRVNQDWNSSFKAMQIGAKLGHKIVWQWIAFRQNEHQIEEGKKIAEDNGIHFMLVKSTRWDKNDPMKPLNKDLVANGTF